MQNSKKVKLMHLYSNSITKRSCFMEILNEQMNNSMLQYLLVSDNNQLVFEGLFGF